MHEVHGPSLIGRREHWARHARQARKLLALAALDLKLFLHVNALCPLAIFHCAIFPQ